jgi:hypothetical protein
VKEGRQRERKGGREGEEGREGGREAMARTGSSAGLAYRWIHRQIATQWRRRRRRRRRRSKGIERNTQEQQRRPRFRV